MSVVSAQNGDTPKTIARPNHHVQAIAAAPSRAFLMRFPPPIRSLLLNVFRNWIRQGVRSPSSVVAAVMIAAVFRHQWGCRWHEIADIVTFHAPLHRLATHRNEALTFAAWALRREPLPKSERGWYRSGRSIPYQQPWMARLTPTERQKASLQRLGYGGPVVSRIRARERIDQLTRGRPHGRAKR